MLKFNKIFLLFAILFFCTSRVYATEMLNENENEEAKTNEEEETGNQNTNEQITIPKLDINTELQLRSEELDAMNRVIKSGKKVVDGLNNAAKKLGDNLNPKPKKKQKKHFWEHTGFISTLTTGLGYAAAIGWKVYKLKQVHVEIQNEKVKTLEQKIEDLGSSTITTTETTREVDIKNGVISSVLDYYGPYRIKDITKEKPGWKDSYNNLKTDLSKAKTLPTIGFKDLLPNDIKTTGQIFGSLGVIFEVLWKYGTLEVPKIPRKIVDTVKKNPDAIKTGILFGGIGWGAGQLAQQSAPGSALGLNGGIFAAGCIPAALLGKLAMKRGIVNYNDAIYSVGSSDFNKFIYGIEQLNFLLILEEEEKKAFEMKFFKTLDSLVQYRKKYLEARHTEESFRAFNENMISIKGLFAQHLQFLKEKTETTIIGLQKALNETEIEEQQQLIQMKIQLANAQIMKITRLGLLAEAPVKYGHFESVRKFFHKNIGCVEVDNPTLMYLGCLLGIFVWAIICFWEFAKLNNKTILSHILGNLKPTLITILLYPFASFVGFVGSVFFGNPGYYAGFLATYATAYLLRNNLLFGAKEKLEPAAKESKFDEAIKPIKDAIKPLKKALVDEDGNQTPLGTFLFAVFAFLLALWLLLKALKPK